jgi:hypothetical protein
MVVPIASHRSRGLAPVRNAPNTAVSHWQNPNDNRPIVPVPLDDDGIISDLLGGAFETTGSRAVYLQRFNHIGRRCKQQSSKSVHKGDLAGQTRTKRDSPWCLARASSTNVTPTNVTPRATHADVTPRATRALMLTISPRSCDQHGQKRIAGNDRNRWVKLRFITNVTRPRHPAAARDGAALL